MQMQQKAMQGKQTLKATTLTATTTIPAIAPTTTRAPYVAATMSTLPTMYALHKQNNCKHCNASNNPNSDSNYEYSADYNYNYNNNNYKTINNKHKQRDYRHAMSTTTVAAAAALNDAASKTLTSAPTSASNISASDALTGMLNLFVLNATLLTAASTTTKLSSTATTTTTFEALIDADATNWRAGLNSSHDGSSNSDSDFSSNINGFDSNYSATELLNEPNIEYIFDNTYIRILFIVLYTLCFCCCVFGNLLVILVVTCSRRLRSITNFFLANLALADFCVGVFCVMQNLSIYLIDSWVFGEFLCRMYQFVHSLSYTASIFILVVICMERYFAIVHPITCKQILTAARLRVVILTVWITAAVYSTPKFVFSKTIKNVHDDGHVEEICVLDRKMYNSKLLDMINFVLLYAIPLLVMTVLYSKIAITLWRSSRGWTHHIAQQQDNGMGLHNSMYHHHHSQQQQQQHHHHQQHGQHATSSTPILGNSSGSMLSRKQSSKYEKRAVSITESQVSLESDRPIVSTCRNKASFYQHHNNHHRHGGPQRGASHMSHSSSNVLRARRGVVRMLIIFVLTFAICNLPVHARKMWQYWGQSYRGDSNFNALLTPLTFLCSYFNSGVNPLLYAFLSRNFRKGMKELLLCSWKKNKGKSSTNSLMHHKRMALQTHSLPTDTTHIGNEQL